MYNFQKKSKGFKEKQIKKGDLDKHILKMIVNQSMKDTINDMYR